MSAPDPSFIYQNGRWEIDLSAREMRLHGLPVPIGGRAFDIIAALARADGELVTKNQLMALVWPGLVVEDNTLQVHISAIRKALGEDREILQTSSGRGYRLLGRWMPRPADLGLATQPSAPTAETRSFHGNLSLPVSELIGRNSAASDVRRQLTAYRLVTLTGPGGIGKSSLALWVARNLVPNFADGCWLVELASLSDPSLVPSALAGALGLRLDLGTDDVSPESVAKSVGFRTLAVLLDNCEHLIDAAAQTAQVLLRTCPNVSVLATSREPLRIEGECVYQVPSLDVPSEQSVEAGNALEHSAVELFVTRMHATGFQPYLTQDDLVCIASICRHLDGIPLAIEFAAARAGSLGLRQVLVGLDHRFDLLKSARRTALPRHQTLRAVLDWSYELLPEAEQRQLRSLGVFAGGFTLEAAAAVDTEDHSSSMITERLANLVAKSLVIRDESGAVSRWRLLETTRAYAIEKSIECGEAENVARLHAHFFRNFVVPGTSISTLPPTIEWIELLSREIDNVRAALDWAFGADGDAVLGVVLTAAYVPVWLHHSLLFECRDRAERALDSLETASSLDAHLAAELQLAVCVALMHTTAVARRIGITLGNALKISEGTDDADLQLRALWAIWTYRFNNGEYFAAKPFAERFSQLALREGHPADVFVANRLMGNTSHFLGNQTTARRYFETIFDSYVPPSGHRHSALFNFDQILLARTMFSRVLWLQGHTNQAKREAHATLAAAENVEHERSLYMSYVLGHAICPIAIMTGDLESAEQSVDMLLELAASHGATYWKSRAPCLRGMLLIKRGEFSTGSKNLRAALDEVDHSEFAMNNPEYLGALAEGLSGLGRVADGLSAIDAAIEQSNREGGGWCIAELLRIKGELLLRAAEPSSSYSGEDCFLQSLHEARRQDAIFWELRAALSLARLRVREGRTDEVRPILAPVCNRFTEGFELADLRSAQELVESYR